MSATPQNRLQHTMMNNARVHVSLLFLVNGFLIGNWAPKIPEFAERLLLDEGQLGVMIAVFGMGALVTMPLTGVVIARIGPVFAVRLTALVAASTLLWVTLAPNHGLAALSLFVFGGSIAGMDVAMNAVAVEVERRRGAPIMSSCHGFWSLGGLFGAVAGGYLLQYAGVMLHALFVTAISAALVGFVLLGLRLDDAPVDTEQRQPIRFPRTLLPYMIGLLALFSAMPEGVVIDWSALYLRQELNADAFVSGLAFGAFSAAMATVRFFGDPVRKRLGAVRTVQICAGSAFIGFLIAGMATSPEIAVAGFLITGLGLSNLVPIAFSAAGNLPGIAPGIALSLTTTIGYSGILVAPVLIGYVAEYTSFSAIFTGLSLMLFAILLMAPNSRYADVGRA
ncbi:MFS transporter [Hoeflea sp. WL0058]|uniref:MFS transporter n=1 Tax=Flavimaribacter sediminis TaxID=2865987 RepID=A0AAE2ZTB3_9HYPH|nr:MFS transporter [Flavimaribacter sediminis]MBW8640168.1 MFS transporter [Flavimaribacter sediminis]